MAHTAKPFADAGRRLLWLEPFWIVLLGVPLTLPGRILPLQWHLYLVIALFLFWPLRWVVARVWPDVISAASHAGLHPATLSARVLLSCVIVSLWVSADRAISWVAAGYLLFGMAGYQALIHWTPARRSYWVGAAALLGCGIGLALVAPPFVVWKPDFRLFYLRLYQQLTSLRFDVGETIHANVLAGQLWVILALFLSPVLRLLLVPTHLALHSPLYFALFEARSFCAGKNSGPQNNRSITAPILLILLWLPANLWAAPDPELAWGAVGYLVYGIAWYGALVRCPPATQAARCQPAWVAGGQAVA